MLFVPTCSLLKAPTLSPDDPAEGDLLQKYQERVERFPQQDQLIEMCTDAGSDSISWQRTLQNSNNLKSRRRLVESTLCPEIRSEGLDSMEHPNWAGVRSHSQLLTRKIWSGNENWICEPRQFHSRVWISHDLNPLVTHSSTNEVTTTTSRKPMKCSSEIFRWKQMFFLLRVDLRQKKKQEHVHLLVHLQELYPSTRILPIGERKWTHIEPEDESPVDYPVSKQLSTSSSWWSASKRRWSDWILEIKSYLRNDFVRSQHWSDGVWKSRLARWGGNKKTIQYCTDSSGAILYLQALQGHSGLNPIDPELQGNVLIPTKFIEYIYHIGCAINVHSITNSRLIAQGQNSRNRQMVLLTAVNPLNKEPNNRMRLSWTHHFLHGTSRKRGEDIKLSRMKGFQLYQTRLNAFMLKTRSQVILSRRLLWWELEKSFTGKYMRHFHFLQRFPCETIGWKNWIFKTPTNPTKNLNPTVTTVGLLGEQPSGSSVQENFKRVMLEYETPVLVQGHRLTVVCQCF